MFLTISSPLWATVHTNLHFSKADLAPGISKSKKNQHICLVYVHRYFSLPALLREVQVDMMLYIVHISFRTRRPVHSFHFSWVVLFRNSQQCHYWCYTSIVFAWSNRAKSTSVNNNIILRSSIGCVLHFFQVMISVGCILCQSCSLHWISVTFTLCLYNFNCLP